MQHRWGVGRHDGHNIKCGQNDSLTLLLGNINNSLIIVKDLVITGPLVHYHEYGSRYSLGYHNRSMQWLEEIAILKEIYNLVHSKQASSLCVLSSIALCFLELVFQQEPETDGKKC